MVKNKIENSNLNGYKRYNGYNNMIKANTVKYL